MTIKKAGRPRIPKEKRLTPRSIAFSETEIEFLKRQAPNVSEYIRTLVNNAMMKEAVNNDK